MQFKEDGFVQNVMCGHAWAPMKQARMSRCKIFWQFCLGLFIGWPITLAFLGTVIVVVDAIALLFSYRMPILPGDGKDGKLELIKHWPSVRGHRLMPWWLLVPVGIWMSGPFLVAFLSSRAARSVAAGFLSFWVLMFVCWGTLKGWRAVRDSEVVALVRARLRAFKDKVCPIDEFK